MNCVATINIGGILCDNARKSISNAAKRWGVEFVEIKTSKWNDRSPSFMKFVLAERLIEYDRVLYIDSDILIRSDTPNPFELFKSDLFCAVMDIHGNLDFNTDYFREFAEMFLIRHMRIIKKFIDINLDEMGFIQKFFNTGVMLFDPKILISIFPYNVDISFDILCNEAHYEQALINYYIQRSGISIRYLDRTWNRIDPDISGEMKDYIYHFTGMKCHIVRPFLPTYCWEGF